jgi:hypothetical protein
VSDEGPKQRKSLIHMSAEELMRGEWMKDPALVAEYKELKKTAVGAIAAAIEGMSDEDRVTLQERLDDGTYEYGQDLIRAEGEM